MKKWLKTILPVFALAFILLIPGIQAKAGNITSINATPGTNQITVSGEAGTGVLSVVIFIYDSTGTNLVQMESVAVDSRHAYTDTFTVEAGTYVVKVADYEGGAFSQTSVTVAAAGTEKYSVSVASNGNGTATASVTEATAGTTVTLTATPNSGYKFKAWSVESGGVTLADSSSATTTFTMPAANVSIKATFEENTSSQPTSTPSQPTSTPSQPTSTPSQPTSTPSQPTSTPSQPTNAPKTSDETNLSLWLLVLMASSAVLAGMIIEKMKRKVR